MVYNMAAIPYCDEVVDKQVSYSQRLKQYRIPLTEYTSSEELSQNATHSTSLKSRNHQLQSQSQSLAINSDNIDNVDGLNQVSSWVGAEQLSGALYGCDLVVIPAGVPRKPGMTRDDLFNINAGDVHSQGTAWRIYIVQVQMHSDNFDKIVEFDRDMPYKTEPAPRTTFAIVLTAFTFTILEDEK